MSESYLSLEPSYYTGPDPKSPPHAHVAVRLEFGADTPTTALRLARWAALANRLERTIAWRVTEDLAAIEAWLNKVEARGYAPHITSALSARRPLDFTKLSLPERLALAGQLLDLGAGAGIRFRALTLLDFVAGGVATPADPLDVVATRAMTPSSWATDPALSGAIAAFAQAALAQESWPGNRAKRYLAERPGLAALL